MQNRINFTQQTLDSIVIPELGKRSYYYDARVIGLGISVTHKGT